MKFLMSVFLTSFMSVANAGFDKGNGGDGFRCLLPTAHGVLASYVVLAEEVEAALRWNLPLAERAAVNEHQAPETEAANRIKTLAALFPELTTSLLDDLNWLALRRLDVVGVELDNLDDDVIAWLPTDCSLVQVAIQTPSNLFIQGEAWSEMDARSKAMLYSHEAIYRGLDRLMVGRGTPLRTSEAVRLINVFLWRDVAKTPTNFDLLSELKLLGIDRLK